MSFAQLELAPHLQSAAQRIGWEEPFPIQSAVIPVFLQGKDIMGIAQTGSGKTGAFSLPMLQMLQDQPRNEGRAIRGLILVPTRELAVQITDVITALKVQLKREIKIMGIYGGVSINPQMKNMFRTDIVVATPGRLLDLLDHKALTLDELQFFGVDEADKMFQMGFEEEMNRILALLPKKRQTFLFSATLNDKVEQLKQQLNIDPIVIEVQAKGEEEIGEIIEEAFSVSAERRGPFLRYLIKDRKMEQVLVFVSAIRTADNLMEKLNKNGIKATSLHGHQSMRTRFDAINAFKKGRVQVLIATDLLARGIDISGLPYVINFELPRSPQDYVHRIGRTGRAGESGNAISLIIPEEEHHFKIIKKKNKKWITLQETEEIDLNGY